MSLRTALHHTGGTLFITTHRKRTGNSLILGLLQSNISHISKIPISSSSSGVLDKLFSLPVVSKVWECFSLEGTHGVALGKLPDDASVVTGTPPLFTLITSKHIQTIVMGGMVSLVLSSTLE